MELGKVDPALLKLAMKALGVAYSYVDGKLVEVYGRVTEAQIKKAYSRQVVMSQARRFGWNVQEQKDGKLVVQKARF